MDPIKLNFKPGSLGFLVLRVWVKGFNVQYLGSGLGIGFRVN